MEKTYTLTQAQLDKVLENLGHVRSNMEYEEKYGNEENHRRYLSEFCGILGVLCNFGLINEWDKFRSAQILAEMEQQERNDD